LLLEKFMATGIPNSRSIARPAKDEWGVYDPEQAGMEALLARLDKDKKIAPVAAGPANRKDIPEPTASARPTPRDTK
jgi:hypothetical protein